MTPLEGGRTAIRGDYLVDSEPSFGSARGVSGGVSSVPREEGVV